MSNTEQTLYGTSRQIDIGGEEMAQLVPLAQMLLSNLDQQFDNNSARVAALLSLMLQIHMMTSSLSKDVAKENLTTIRDAAHDFVDANWDEFARLREEVIAAAAKGAPKQ